MSLSLCLFTHVYTCRSLSFFLSFPCLSHLSSLSSLSLLLCLSLSLSLSVCLSFFFLVCVCVFFFSPSPSLSLCLFFSSHSLCLALSLFLSLSLSLSFVVVFHVSVSLWSPAFMRQNMQTRARTLQWAAERAWRSGIRLRTSACTRPLVRPLARRRTKH